MWECGGDLHPIAWMVGFPEKVSHRRVAWSPCKAQSGCSVNWRETGGREAGEQRDEMTVKVPLSLYCPAEGGRDGDKPLAGAGDEGTGLRRWKSQYLAVDWIWGGV